MLFPKTRAKLASRDGVISQMHPKTRDSQWEMTRESDLTLTGTIGTIGYGKGRVPEWHNKFHFVGTRGIYNII